MFGDPLEVTIPDLDHSTTEQRYLSVGFSVRGRVLVVSYAEPVDDTIRIISAREASRRERNDYESG